MSYRIEIQKTPLKFIQKQNKRDQERIMKCIKGLPNWDIKKLKGFDNTYRARVGDFRILFNIDIDNMIVLITEVGNRGDVYK